MAKVAVLQSNYLPWKGYFDIIAAVDTFVVYDVVQYTKNDWRNRNKVKKPGGGTKWLTVPVFQRRLEQSINETEIADRDILDTHWRTIEQYYRDAACFDVMQGRIARLFDRDCPTHLSELNVALLDDLCQLLGIDTEMVRARDLELSGGPTERLVDICRQLGADTYLSGPAAREYMDTTLFDETGIAIEWMDYEGYPEYRQPHPPFNHHVSIIDLLMCTGEDAADHMLQTAGDRA